MEFRLVLLILALYHVRPHDWIPGIEGINILAPLVLLTALVVIQRGRLDDWDRILRTPHAWFFLGYAAYASLTSGNVTGTAREFLILFLYFFIVIKALDSERRIYLFGVTWAVCVLILAALGVGSLYGIDFTQAKELTERQENRLAIGTWLHNNPNAYGHTVIVAIPLVYFWLFWKRSIGSRLVALALMYLAFHCVVHTESKGAFLSGFAAATACFMFGRPKFVQVLVLVSAVTVGGALLAALPRMTQMNNLRADEGVLGRLLVWEAALTQLRNDATGTGWRQFQAWYQWEGEMISKGTHSSYVEIGANLGWPGLFFFFGMLWLIYRTLARSQLPDSEEIERTRRMFAGILVAYAASSWMVQWAYRMDFLFLLAASGALSLVYHRRTAERRALEEGRLPEEGEEQDAAEPLSGAGAGMPPPIRIQVALAGGPSVQQLQVEDAPARRWPKLWVKPTLADIAMAAVGAWVVVYIWEYVIKNI